MNPLVGTAALWVGVLAAGAAVAAALVGGWARVPAGRLVRRLVGVSAAALGVAVAALAWALLTSDFSLAVVADHSRRGAPAAERVAGLWAGLAGSLLLWAALLAAGGWWGLRLAARPRSASATPEEPGDRAELLGAAGLVAFLVAGTGATLLGLADPFARLAVPGVDGAGVTPILRHPSMLVHPPLLYLAEALLVPLFVLGVAGLVRPAGLVVPVVHRLASAAWAVLTVAVLLGAEWAYVELGWGGFWAWDPVENTGLLPWLALTVLVHAGRGAERAGPAGATGGSGDAGGTELARGSGRRIATLAVLPLLLALAGGVLTRSGATASVHAFAEAPDVGRLLGLVVAVVAVAVGVLAVRAWIDDRRRCPTPAPPRWLADRSVLVGPDAPQLLGLAVLVVVAFGTAWPVVAGDGRFVSGSFYTRLAGPLVVVALVLAGLVGSSRGRAVQLGVAAATAVVVVVVGWREPLAVVLAAAASSTVVACMGGLVRRGGASSVGMHLGHLGFALLMLGVAGSTAGRSVVVALEPGQATTVARVEVGIDELAVVDPADVPAGVESVEATVVLRGATDGVVRPRLDVHTGAGVVLAESDRISSWHQDVQVVLRDANDRRGLLQVNVVPLVGLVWLGGALIAAGAVASVVSAAARSAKNSRTRATSRDNRPSALVAQLDRAGDF